AFALFLVAGISDAVDGFLAKRFHMASELGAYLDPLADKALIVSIYVALGIAGALPISLVILVVSRDIMIISGFMLSWLIGKPMPVRPLAISKVNTVAQIFLATFVLAEQGFHFNSALLSAIVVLLVAVLTVLSIAFYLAEWVRHMNSLGRAHCPPPAAKPDFTGGVRGSEPSSCRKTCVELPYVVEVHRVTGRPCFRRPQGRRFSAKLIQRLGCACRRPEANPPCSVTRHPPA